MRGVIILNLILAIMFLVAMIIYNQLDDIESMVSCGIFSIFNLICAAHANIINKLK